MKGQNNTPVQNNLTLKTNTLLLLISLLSVGQQRTACSILNYTAVSEFLKCWPYCRKWDLAISLLGLDSVETSRGNSHVRISRRKSDDTGYKFQFLSRTCSDFSVGSNWDHLTTVFPIDLRLLADTYFTHKDSNYSSLYKYLEVSWLHQNQHGNIPQVLLCKTPIYTSTNLYNSADKNIVALMVNPVSHQNFVYHRDKDLVLHKGTHQKPVTHKSIKSHLCFTDLIRNQLWMSTLAIPESRIN